MALSGLVACRRVMRAFAWLDQNAPEGWEDRVRAAFHEHGSRSVIAYGSTAPQYAASAAFDEETTPLGEFLARFGFGIEWARAHGMVLMPEDLVTEPVLAEVWKGFLTDTLNPEQLVLKHLT